MLKYLLTALYLSLLVALLYQPIDLEQDMPNDYNLNPKKQMKANYEHSEQKIARQVSVNAKDSLADQSSVPALNIPVNTQANFVSLQVLKNF